ncbi:MAG: hypothetical protein CVT88_03090 [Candidatus Altiarchaeales archaeon HGW-Altiarchaeales-1]|nr:MAG: hypothetical protein CVT88_03090 [Candidatus Altiarchaeales archaeon HGW-Altiarchaeales-1]
MIFGIEWSERAEQTLSKLPGYISSRIVRKVDIKSDPFHYLEHYEGNDVYKLRIGDYRALIDVDFENKLLKIVIVRYRSKIYEQKL